MKKAIVPGIPAGNNIRKVMFLDGDTDDIIKTIMHADKDAAKYTKDFAQSLKGKNMMETCRNIWTWCRANVKYKIDPFAQQWIKSPAQTITDGYADCKSFSILVGSLFRNIYPGAPVYYRFASFSSANIPTHVYVVAKDRGRDIIMDCVLPQFNYQKQYTYKKDYQMAEITYISGVGSANDDEKFRVPLGSNADWLNGSITDADFDLNIYRDKIVTEQKHVAGIGRVIKAQQYGELLAKVDRARRAVRKFRHHKLSGIGSAADAQFENDLLEIQAGVHGIGKTKVGKFLKKVATGAKKVAKAVVKVATAPARLAIKGVLEVALPKAAPFFKYLFITNPTTLANLPAKVKKKRGTAEKIANFIVNTIGMKREHFMGIVRNGFAKHHGGKSPETVLASELKGQAITGIGVLPVVLIPVLIGLIQKIAKLFKKKAPDVSEDDAPDSSDFDEMPTAQRQATAKRIKQDAGPEYIDPEYEENSNGSPTGKKKSGIC